MPLKISLEISDAGKKELDALACFLTVCAGDIVTPDAVPEASFSLTPNPPVSSEPEPSWGPHLVPNPSDASPAESQPVQAGNVDKSGLPWDERIHASTRALTADGLWRKKRGVSDAEVATVEAQLRGVMAIPLPAVVPPPPAAAAVPPPPTTVAAAPAPPTADFQTQFVTLIGRVATALAAGKITQDQIKKCAESAGLPNIQMLYNRPDLLGQVKGSIDAIIGAA